MATSKNTTSTWSPVNSEYVDRRIAAVQKYLDAFNTANVPEKEAVLNGMIEDFVGHWGAQESAKHTPNPVNLVAKAEQKTTTKPNKKPNRQ